LRRNGTWLGILVYAFTYLFPFRWSYLDPGGYTDGWGFLFNLFSHLAVVGGFFIGYFLITLPGEPGREAREIRLPDETERSRAA